MASEIYEEIKIPDHHRILTLEHLIKPEEKEEINEVDIYGTSTILNILEKDGRFDVLEELQNKIKNVCDNVRRVLYKILEEDELYENEEDYEYYTFFNLKKICVDDDFIMLLPPTVSRDTFNTCYPFYKELMKLKEEKRNKFERIILQETNKEANTNVRSDIDSFFSSFSSKKPSVPKYKIIYKNDCKDYIKGIKQYLKMFLLNDDYVINSYGYFVQQRIFDLDKELCQELNNILIDDLVKKMCRLVINSIKEWYKTSYVFGEIKKYGLKYKIIPKGFLFYRSYPSIDPPFPKKRPYVWVGFSFLDVVNYTRPSNDDFEKLEDTRKNSYNYCRLLGNVSTIKTKKELKLLDLTDRETVQNLNKEMPPEISVIFSQGWIITETGDIKRNSEFGGDSQVAQWLYENNYDGYIGYDFPGFHDECCISSDISLQYIEEPVKGMGLKFPLELVGSFPMQQLVPLCQEPFNKINYTLSLGFY